MTPTSRNRDAQGEDLDGLEYDNQPYNWEPGVALPISTPTSHHTPNFYTPRPPLTIRQRDDSLPVRRYLMTEDPSLANDFEENQQNSSTSEKAVLESILSSQKQMQETMNQLLHRVDALEDTVKEFLPLPMMKRRQSGCLPSCV